MGGGGVPVFFFRSIFDFPVSRSKLDGEFVLHEIESGESAMEGWDGMWVSVLHG